MFASVKILAMMFFMYPSVSGGIPSKLIGNWVVETAYNTPGPIGLDNDQEKYIKSLDVVYTSGSFNVCNKMVAVHSVSKTILTEDQFVQTYGFLPRLIGLKGTIVDIILNSSDGTNTCGDFEDPGAHILIGDHEHVVIEVANEYFSLVKRKRIK